jgi:hypothetical protein
LTKFKKSFNVYFIKINVWGLSSKIEQGFGNAPLQMAINIFNAAEYYLYPLGGLANSGPTEISKLKIFSFTNS